MLAATPFGMTLAPEGGAHQSINSPLIGMSQPGLASFEPAFADELSLIMDFAFQHMQAVGGGERDPDTSLNDAHGGSTHLRLSTRPLEQPQRTLDDATRKAVIAGGYWLRKPGPNADVVVAYQGVVAPAAIQSAARIATGRTDVGVLAITSADRLMQGWRAAQAERRAGRFASCHLETLLAGVPRYAGIVTAIDGHPATISWLGGMLGHRTVTLGVDQFGQTGRIDDLHRHFEIDADANLSPADQLSPRAGLRLAAS